MADPSNESQHPLDPKNKHLYYLWPYIVYSRNYGPLSPNSQPVSQEIEDNFDFNKDIKDYVSKNIDEICEQLSTRWLVSLTDTYADCSSDVGERLAACNISTVVRLTQASTAHMKQRGVLTPEYTEEKKKEYMKLRKIYENHYFLCDGVHCIPGTDGVYTNLISRTSKNIKGYKELHKIFKKVIDVLLINETSFLPFLPQNLNKKKIVRLIKESMED